MIYFTIMLMLIFLGSIRYYAHKIVYPKIKDIDQTYIDEVENKRFDPEFLNKFDQKTIYLGSNPEYDLHGIIYENNTSKFVIFCHGITMSHISSLKYTKIFLDLGYSVLVYDHRNHGKSGKNHTSFGYYEKSDAKLWVDYLYEKYDNPLIGVHGESMGASTALQLVTIDNRLGFCIEDCGYSDALELFKYRSANDNNFIISLLTYPTNLYIKLIYKWNFAEVSVDKFINKATCPIMFIHGEMDKYVPAAMVYDLYNAYQNEKYLYIAKDATHAKSFTSNPELYREKIHDFLKKNGFN